MKFRNTILSLIACSHDYGFYDDVLMDGLADLLDRKLTTDEIISYCNWFLTEEAKAQGYSMADFEASYETLSEFKEKYIK